MKKTQVPKNNKNASARSKQEPQPPATDAADYVHVVQWLLDTHAKRLDTLLVSLPADLRLIVRAAAKQTVESEQTDVSQAIQNITETLFSSAADEKWHVPENWHSQTPLGRLVAAAQIWCKGESLITLAEAARLLYAQAITDKDMTVQAAIVSVSRLTALGKLTAYHDLSDTHPLHQRRFVRDEIERLRDTPQNAKRVLSHKKNQAQKAARKARRPAQG